LRPAAWLTVRRGWQEAILLQHTVFIPDPNGFAELLQGKRKRELTAERVTVGPNVTQDANRW